MGYTVTGLVVQYHSEQAMVAARKMSRTKHKKQKRQTGQIVCHHLKMMLKREPANGSPTLAYTVIGETGRRVVDLCHDEAQIQLTF